MRFAIVDAFAEEVFGGNPAGVVILPEGKDFPSDEIMIKTAAELRYSETVFIKKLDGKRFHLRYFTPAAEVELCGHATIAAFHFLREEGLILPGNTYINETLAGALNVAVDEKSVLMDMGDPQIIGEIPEERREELYEVMGLDKVSDTDMVPKMVSTGLPDIFMPVQDEEELEKIDPDFKVLTDLSKSYEVVGVHAFTVNSKDGKIHARNFAPLYDIDEEAATGTANGALTYYLHGYGLIKDNEINTVIQGEKMKRPSVVETKLVSEGDKKKIMVGGSAATLAVGEISLD